MQPNKDKLSLQGDLKIQFLSTCDEDGVVPHLHYTIEVPVPDPLGLQRLHEVLPKALRHSRARSAANCFGGLSTLLMGYPCNVNTLKEKGKGGRGYYTLQ